MRSFLEYWSNTLENYTFSSAPETVELDVAVEVAEQLALFLPMKKETCGISSSLWWVLFTCINKETIKA